MKELKELFRFVNKYAKYGTIVFIALLCYILIVALITTPREYEEEKKGIVNDISGNQYAVEVNQKIYTIKKPILRKYNVGDPIEVLINLESETAVYHINLKEQPYLTINIVIIGAHMLLILFFTYKQDHYSERNDIKKRKLKNRTNKKLKST